MADLAQFRSEIATWLEENCPPGARGPGQIANGSSKVVLDEDTGLWLERMAERGFTVPTWPKEYGGAGLTSQEAAVLYQEMSNIKARSPLMGMGTAMIGLSLIHI